MRSHGVDVASRQAKIQQVAAQSQEGVARRQSSVPGCQREPKGQNRAKNKNAWKMHQVYRGEVVEKEEGEEEKEKEKADVT